MVKLVVILLFYQLNKFNKSDLIQRNFHFFVDSYHVVIFKVACNTHAMELLYIILLKPVYEVNRQKFKPLF